ncbi:MAG: cupin domain-containing protein [Desulfovibrio sp.]|jgi:quercetin dioxygenase-like cupin family protein|nr:cupin domain-containing protein [Desulfovibrio sp.]
MIARIVLPAVALLCVLTAPWPGLALRLFSAVAQDAARPVGLVQPDTVRQDAAPLPGAAQPAGVTAQTLLGSSSAWDGSAYTAYPAERPQLSVLRISIAPRTVLAWHSHPMPNAAYVLSGELTVEKLDGTKRRFMEGETVAEMVGVTHRGVAGERPVVLIVFYAGAPGMPLSEAAGP